MGEFDLIARYFSRPVPEGYLGAGDDCALLPLRPGRQCVVSTDALIEGRHFLPEVDPLTLGHKSLAVNLSDLAAMGATPSGCVLALALPEVDEGWLSQFSEGFYRLANEFDCPLIGGDTTGTDHGIMICVTVFGHVTPGTALLRSAAQSGDDIWVTGSLGAAHIALKLLQGALPHNDSLLAKTRPMLEQPCPPCLFAAQLPGLAHAALDISDGFLQDLGHIIKASQCGAHVIFDHLPIDPAIRNLSEETVQEAVLSGGDVYQLCFTAPPKHRDAIETLAQQFHTEVSRVGSITGGGGLLVETLDGRRVTCANMGYQHF
ncbi:thiamine-phosphate kinase [Neopusillimonas maritima]|uniref:Thiamine-monophosphate kinase n=1 Tax=Neopusillimonas maritima TaxID=2026239 RepID=A0ABX9MSN8_9BURK|nr:thiamine-phosphate kinase [Neopusillimonas maritima]RII81832.1 thiamine-phosphate kinase [Neopusillimonas maritima]